MAALVAAVTAVAEAGVRSGVDDAAVTVFVNNPAASARATTVMTVRAPEAMSPRLQVTELPATLQEPTPGVADTKPRVGGRLSVKTTALAVSGP